MCNAVSAFSSMILNHPDINIETNQCSEKINEEMSHAWNEVKINDKWYSCDFTQNMTPFNNYYTILKLYHSYENLLKKLNKHIIKREFNLSLEKILINTKMLSRDILVNKPSIFKNRIINIYKNEEIGHFKKYSTLTIQELFENYNQIMDIDVSLENIVNLYNRLCKEKYSK